MRKTVASLVVLTFASSAMAFPFTFFNAGPLDSNTTSPGAPNNATWTAVYGGPSFTAGNVSVSGTLTEVNTGTFANEARFCLTNTSLGSPIRYCSSSTTTTGNFVGSIVINNPNIGNFVTVAPTSPTGNQFVGSTFGAGTWRVDHYESFDDGGVSSIDARWTDLTITVNDFVPPTPPPSTPLTKIGPGRFRGTATLDATQAVTWFQIDVPAPGAGGTTGMVIDSVGSILTANSFGPNDTQIGLYNSLGQLLVMEDDITFIASGNPGNILTSRIRAGNVTGFELNPPLGTSESGGVIASLAAGTYYLAVSKFSATFGSAFNVTSTGTTSGTIQVNVSSNVPEPATLALLGLGSLALLRRRR